MLSVTGAWLLVKVGSELKAPSLVLSGVIAELAPYPDALVIGVVSVVY